MGANRCDVCGRTPAASGIKRLLPRAARTSAVVGTVLVLLNQGDVLADAVWPVLVAINRGGALSMGEWPASLWWRIPLTFLVPFTVSLQAGYLATRR